MSDRRGFDSKFRALAMIANRRILRDEMAGLFRQHLLYGECTFDKAAFADKVRAEYNGIRNHIVKKTTSQEQSC